MAARLLKLLVGVPPWGKLDVDRALPWVGQETGLTLSRSQQEAVRTVLRSKVSVITGVPGVGKTTLVNSLLRIIRAKRIRVLLCAPTGRAVNVWPNRPAWRPRPSTAPWNSSRPASASSAARTTPWPPIWWWWTRPP